MKKWFGWLSVCLGMLWTGGAAERPHIVFILADDMGYGDVSCYNPEGKIQTPHLDRLAAGGVRFTDAHSGGSSCIPSRYSLMTGRFAVRRSMSLDKGPLIEPTRVTVPSLLREAGYETAMVGKWHLGFDPFPQHKTEQIDFSKPFVGGPVDCGFDSFFGMHASLDIQPYFYFRDRNAILPPDQPVAARDSVGGDENWNHIQGAFWRAGLKSKDFDFDDCTPRLMREAVSVIDRHAKGANEKPLFLYLALPSPHTPWLPLEAFRGKSGAGMYGDFVLQVDAVVGDVMAALTRTGMKDDTLVFFSSDNGPVWYEKDRERFGHRASGGLRGMKFDSWEGGHRMPFIAHWPRKVAAGGVTDQTIAFADVLATLGALVGAKPVPEGMAEDSESFLPWLLDAGKPPAVRAPIVQDRVTVRAGDWKFILPKNKRRAKEVPEGELYNLKTDRDETNNRVGSDKAKAQEMRALLADQLRSLGR